MLLVSIGILYTIPIFLGNIGLFVFRMYNFDFQLCFHKPCMDGKVYWRCNMAELIEMCRGGL